MEKLLTLVLALGLALGLAGCGGSEDDSNDPIRLGTFGPLTGGLSIYGVAAKQGAQLAVDEIGSVLGRPLELIAYDSKGDAVEGTNSYNRLTQEDEIVALVGGTLSGETIAIKPLSISDGLPVLTPTATNPEVTLDAENVFRACYTDSFQGALIGRFVAEDLDLSKGAILFNKDDAYSEGLAAGFKSAYTGEIVAEEAWSAGDIDFTALLANIQSTDAEFIFVPGYTQDVGAILTQASEMGLDLPMIGGDGWDGIEQDYADVAEGHYFGNHYAKSDSSQIVQDFVANYTEKYGEAPNALAALAYDAVYTMVAAIEAAGSTDSDAIIAALADTHLPGLVTGDISFDAVGDPIKPVTMIQFVNGEHVVIKKVSGE